MASVAPYIPTKDSMLDLWALNFTSLLTASPATYAQTSGTAATCAAAYASWHAAYLLVTSPSTKTADTVQAKNAQKVMLLATLRPVAQSISLSPAVEASDKVAIGVNPRTSTPAPITAPTTYPILNIQAGAALQLYVRYRDSAASPSVKSKPYGCGAVTIKFLVSATPITDVNALTGLFVATKSPALMQFSSADGGKQCYMAAFYQMKNGKQSGFGPIVSFTVPLAA